MIWDSWCDTYPDIVAEEISHDALNDVKADVCSILIILDQPDNTWHVPCVNDRRLSGHTYTMLPDSCLDVLGQKPPTQH